MMLVKLRNKSKYSFKDIAGERYRTYVFAEGTELERKVRIERPQWLSVSASGGHRIVDSAEVSHYIPCGWDHLYWEVDKDANHFVT